MNFDRVAQIKHRVWDGTINIRVVLEYTPNLSSKSSSPQTSATSSSSSPAAPVVEEEVVLPHTSLEVKEFLISVYRNSYLPTFIPLIAEYFSEYVEGLAHVPAWLEWHDTPLKWNLPVGVLYDMLPLAQKLYVNSTEDASNVWTLHYRYKDQYPRSAVIPFIYTLEDGAVDYAKSLNELMINQLKQSCFVMNGSAKPMLNLSRDDSDKIWDSIQNHNLAHYNQVNRRICPRDPSLLLKIPVKIYIPGFPQVVQHPVSPTNTDGTPTSLKDVLESGIPELSLTNRKLRVLVHGISVDEMLETSVLNYWELFRYIDNFLHVVVF